MIKKSNTQGPDFIGIGGQRCATSWIYAGLYEHPQLCLPFKEINFFSRPRYEEKGIEWYRGRWASCPSDVLKGEYSTSYLSSPVAAERIHRHIPFAQLIACLRDPVERAYSAYFNDIRSGAIAKTTAFQQALRDRPSYVNDGFYAKHLSRYRQFFPRKQLLTLIYDDIAKDPRAFFQTIHRFLGVDDAVVPSTVLQKINTSRAPRVVGVDRIMLGAARALRAAGLHRLVWAVKKSGVPHAIRSLNTAERREAVSGSLREELRALFRDDVRGLSQLIGRDMLAEWWGEQL